MVLPCSKLSPLVLPRGPGILLLLRGRETPSTAHLSPSAASPLLINRSKPLSLGGREANLTTHISPLPAPSQPNFSSTEAPLLTQRRRSPAEGPFPPLQPPIMSLGFHFTSISLCAQTQSRQVDLHCPSFSNFSVSSREY